jgi:hypothetical protein
MNLKILFIWAILMLGCVRSSNLEIVETKSNYSSYAHYNPRNDRILFFGILTDSTNQIIGSTISIQNFLDKSETVIDRDIGYPAIGWIDSSSVLIYKTFPETAKSFFDTNYKKILYRFNIFSDEYLLLEDIPLDSTKDRITVSENIILYQTGYAYNQSLKLFKYDVNTQKKEEITKLRGMNISEHNYVYNNSSNAVVFVSFSNDKFYLQSLKENERINLDFSSKSISQLCLDYSNERIFYITQDGKDYEYQQLLKSYNYKTGKIKIHYAFDMGIECLQISLFKENELMLSLTGFAYGKTSKQTFEKEDIEVSLDIDPTRHIYILDI